VLRVLFLASLICLIAASNQNQSSSLPSQFQVIGRTRKAAGHVASADPLSDGQLSNQRSGFSIILAGGLSELFLLVVFKSTLDDSRPHDHESADPLTRQHSLPRFARLKSSSPIMLARSCLRSTRILSGARNGASSFAKVRPREMSHPSPAAIEGAKTLPRPSTATANISMAIYGTSFSSNMY
jgi:hypothetical protein